MAITRKPKAKPVDVDSLINKGGSVATTGAPKAKAAQKVTQVALRIPADIAGRLNHALDNRSVKYPRHTWILEAIAEKLDRESI